MGRRERSDAPQTGNSRNQLRHRALASNAWQERRIVFFFFSNQMGWLASIAISLIVTLVLLAIFGVL
jgi:hypothetical protein